MIENEPNSEVTPASGIIVAAGSSNADATQLHTRWARIVSVPSGSGIKLVPTRIFAEVLILRSDHTDADLTLYPFDGDTIAGDDAAVMPGNLGPGSAAVLRCLQAGQWDVVGSVTVDGVGAVVTGSAVEFS